MKEINLSTKEVVKQESGIRSFEIFNTPISAIREAMYANVGEAGLTTNDLEQIKIPAGGGTTWALHGPDGEESAKELVGIIIAKRDIRAYWSVRIEDSNGNMPPDCHSTDARMGIGKPGGDCQRCSFAQFGSGSKGEGQACKLTRQLFLMFPDNILPTIVNLPPTSLKPTGQYLLRLAAKGVPYYGVITKIGLEKAKNPQGIVYGKAVFTSSGRLTPEEAQQVKEYAGLIEPWLKAAPTVRVAKGMVETVEGEVV